MGEPIVPIVQGEKLRLEADGGMLARGGVWARTCPARADFCPIRLLWERESFRSAQAHAKPKLGDVGWGGGGGRL